MALFGRENARDQLRVEAYRAWFMRQHPLALVSALLSIFSLTHFGTLFVDELAGIALGVIAIRRAARSPHLSTRLAYLGIIVGGISLACAFALYFHAARDDAMGCFTAIFNTVVLVLVMVTLIRWFEQTIEAVDHRAWGQLTALIVFPFSVWLFPSRVAAGRPSPFPLHEPVRGFGSMPLTPPPPPAEAPLKPPSPPPPKRKSGIDPEQIAKLKEKMRQQGMLPPDGE